MAKQRISRAAYAKQAGLSRARITQLVQAGVIVLHRGLVDPVEADAARQRRVAPRMRGPAGTVHMASEPDLSFLERMPICQGCGGRYTEDVAADLNSPDPVKFCCDLCAQDVANGFDSAEILERRNLEVP